ncbi:MBL fold metallo-hydrolase [Candidatus Bathyarchaeota archaeon ex4484_205]|nr:MAG: MBL fold metallo-hydrolase [Candidatus Bathyarchaeota archaeon ex4484_205]
MASTKEKMRELLIRLPEYAEIERIEFEGPRIALYSKNPSFLYEGISFTSELAKAIRKRIILRTVPDVRMSIERAEETIKKLLPKEAGLSNLFFDPALGEVHLILSMPAVVEANDGQLLKQIIDMTGWKPKVVRAPPLHSDIVHQVTNILTVNYKERSNILKEIGERIFRNSIAARDFVSIAALGGAREVGRSCFLVITGESKILLDCGINPGIFNPRFSYPRLDLDVFDLSNLDAVVISHAHLDHCGFLPFLFKYGYRGPVYCSEPTLPLMTLLLLDLYEVMHRNGLVPPFSKKDIRETILHTIPLRYGSVTDISPDIKLTLHNAGHILGSSIVHLHIGEGFYNLVYTGDFKYARTTLLEPAVAHFPRVEAMIMESTYGDEKDKMPPRNEVEAFFVSVVKRTIERGGKVLIPSLAVGRAQEILLVLDSYMHRGEIPEVPIYVDGMITEVTAIHSAYPHYLSKELRSLILEEDENPFQSEYITTVKSFSTRNEIIRGGPCIIVATSGMLEGGPVLEYFRYIAPDENSAIIFVSYQIEGTLGRRVLNGAKEVKLPSQNEGKKIEYVHIHADVAKVEGFSGHSDRDQLSLFTNRVCGHRCRILIVHGEYTKSLSFAHHLRKKYGSSNVDIPQIGDVIRLI